MHFDGNLCGSFAKIGELFSQRITSQMNNCAEVDHGKLKLKPDQKKNKT